MTGNFMIEFSDKNGNIITQLLLVRENNCTFAVADRHAEARSRVKREGWQT